MPEHPKTIGKYAVTRPLGKGAMGMVYEGFDPVIERRVAIKTILAENLDSLELEEAVARFKREAQAGGRLQHPCIVGVYEYGNEDDMGFIVMEFVDGRELKRIIADGHKFEMIEIFEIMKQLLSALDYSHKQGVVHRDIKPANLMLQPGPKVKVMDFGIARLESSSLTQVGTVVGTPTHMSPEQLMGFPADGRADLWSSGVILYELLTGLSPFLAETPAQVMHKVLQEEPRKPTALKPEIPAGFDNIIARALAKKPEERFQTAREFQATLLSALQGKPVSATAVSRSMDPMRTLSHAQAARAEGARATPAARAFTLPPEALAEIERSLSRHIGPLARILIQRGQEQAKTVDELFRLLADNIPDDEEQTAFLNKIAAFKPKASATAPKPSAATRAATAAHEAQMTRSGFTPEVLATAEKRLASYVGPLARILIKEAAGQTGSLKELYTALASHIDSEDERRAFLASLPR
ncbi:MAG: serine/threonine protein kinase [Usitatibacter sp.]